jgi:hypothetical protein
LDISSRQAGSQAGEKEEHHINKTKIISHRQKTWEMCNVITIMNMNVREWRGDKKTKERVNTEQLNELIMMMMALTVM